ncbi:enoyl reductase [Naematelia encephala]|uniref:Enoyl reductase n=1 Tax=Naematelia encephala TaxID=71784 RepID=A0A1Y2BA54_9TREE|nr:enoyl reductase [Naematelia encephala]
MPPSIPKTMKALMQEDKERKVSIKEVPVPTLEANDVLVKIEYTALNPTDWKHSAVWSPPGCISGCDFSGTVVSIGTDLAVPLKVGDKVAGAVHGGVWPDKGSNAEYARAESDLVFKVPEGLEMDKAATFGVPWLTACQTLIESQGQQFPPAKVSGSPWLLIYGGSSSVGLFAIQLAKAMGYRVVAVCSPHSFDFVKSYGADELVDYHGGDAASEIKRITDGTLDRALDAISEGSSFEIAIGGFGKQGRLNCILQPSDEVKGISKDVEIVFTTMKTLFGKAYKFGSEDMPASAKDRAFLVELMRKTPEIITKYGIRANRLLLRNGLEHITEGWQEMKEGKVSGKKLVYRIEE